MISITLRNLFLGALCGFMAAATIHIIPSHAAAIDDAKGYIEKVGNRAVETISDKTLDKASKAKKIEQMFRETVDTAWVGRFVVGRFWRQASEDQKKRYLKQYEDFLTRQYATRFTEYTGGSFKITSANDDGEGEFTITMEIQGDDQGSKPVIVDYRVRTADKGQYKIFDIIIEGVSMITTQRSEFSSVISNKGMDYLITQLSSNPEILAIPLAKP